MMHLRKNHLNLLLPRLAFALLAAFLLPLSVAACGSSEKESDTTGGSRNESDAGENETELWNFQQVDEIIIEAEEGAAEAPMVLKPDDSDPRQSEIHRASGGKYVHLPKDSGGGEEAGGKVTFEFEVDSDSPGRLPYVLWARVRWVDACSNTFKVVMDGGEARTIGGDRTYNTWQWVRIAGDAAKMTFRLIKSY